MNWKSKTITYEDLAQILREERMTKRDIGNPGDFNNGLDIVMFRFGALLSDEEQEADFYREALGE